MVNTGQKKIGVVVDTREQHAFTFDPDQVDTVHRALPAGDYALVGYEQDAVVERKTLDDFVGTVIRQRSRFHKELLALAKARHACVVVEASLRDVIEQRYTGGADHRAVLGAVHSITVDFGIPVFFCGDRQAACAFVEGYLRRCAKRLAASDGDRLSVSRHALLRQLPDDIRSDYQLYELALLRQIVKGSQTHGDSSFELSDVDIEWEKLEELIDADVGWSFVPFARRLRCLRTSQGVDT